MMIKNNVSRLLWSLSGEHAEIVELYLEQKATTETRLKDNPDALVEFEEQFKAGSWGAEFWCVIVNLANERPYYFLFAIIALIYVVASIGVKLFMLVKH